MPSVICVRTESSGGRSPINRSQGGVAVPLLRTVPSSCTCSVSAARFSASVWAGSADDAAT